MAGLKSTWDRPIGHRCLTTCLDVFRVTIILLIIITMIIFHRFTYFDALKYVTLWVLFILIAIQGNSHEYYSENNHYNCYSDSRTQCSLVFHERGHYLQCIYDINGHRYVRISILYSYHTLFLGTNRAVEKKIEPQN